jgi:WD40 repeat protein
MYKMVFLLNFSLLLSYNVFAQEDEYIIKILKYHKAIVNSVAFSPDQNYLVSGGEDKLLMVYDLKKMEPFASYPDNYFAPHGIEITQTNTIFVGSGPDIRMIDLKNKTLAVFKGNTTHIWSIDYAPESNILTAGSYDYKIKVWDVSTQTVIFTLDGHQKSTLPVAFSPDEKYIVSGSLDKTVKIWNAKTGELLKSLEKHSDNIFDIEFYPTGHYFASASRDKTIRLWDFETGEVVKTYVGHDKGIMDIEFTPDGSHLLSASLDGSIRLYETRTAKLVYTFTGHEGAINCIAINSDGTMLASCGADSKVILWKLDKKIFVEYAFYDEFHQELDSSGLFKPKEKSESKQDYESRMVKAKQKETELVENYYIRYIQNLREQPFK